MFTTHCIYLSNNGAYLADRRSVLRWDVQIPVRAIFLVFFRNKVASDDFAVEIELAVPIIVVLCDGLQRAGIRV